MTRSATGSSAGKLLAAILVLSLAGCTALTTQVLVNESGRPRPAGTVHCSGSEWTDNSLIAVVPIPIIGLATTSSVPAGRATASPTGTWK